MGWLENFPLSYLTSILLLKVQRSPFIQSFLAVISHHPVLTSITAEDSRKKRRVLSNLMLWGNVFSFIVASKITFSSRMPISNYATAAIACEGFKRMHPPFSCVLASWIWNLRNLNTQKKIFAPFKYSTDYIFLFQLLQIESYCTTTSCKFQFHIY